VPASGRELWENPFAVLVVGFSQVCSEQKPANAEHYEAAVAAYFTGHSEEYEKLGLDPEFPKKLHEFRQIIATMSHAELESECAALLSKGKNTAHPDELRK